MGSGFGQTHVVESYGADGSEMTRPPGPDFDLRLRTLKDSDPHLRSSVPKMRAIAIEGLDIVALTSPPLAWTTVTPGEVL